MSLLDWFLLLSIVIVAVTDVLLYLRLRRELDYLARCLTPREELRRIAEESARAEVARRVRRNQLN